MSTAPRLLQLEFAGRPSTETFGRLRAELGPVPARPIDPVQCNVGVAEYTDLAARCGRLLQLLELPAHTTMVIQAYCTATPLALAAAAEFERAGHRVRLVQVFDPEAVTAAHVESSFCELADKLGNPPARSAEYVHEVLAAGTDRADTLSRLRVELMSAGTRFAQSLGVTGAAADSFALELIDRYSGWLNYLLSVLDTPFPGVENLTVYRTRPCSSVTALEFVAAEFRDAEFVAEKGPLDCPELLAGAVLELREHGIEAALAS